MPNKSKCLYSLVLILCLLITGCCGTYDSRVAPGYPFNGNSHELDFIVINSADSVPDTGFLGSYLDSLPYISDTSQYQRIFDTMPDFDLNIYNIVFLKIQINNANEATIQKRILIDHKANTYTIELRGHIRSCYYFSRTVPHFESTEFLLIPKVPDGYTFSIKRFLPD